jgi:hypothetical protein
MSEPLVSKLPDADMQAAPKALLRARPNGLAKSHARPALPSS